MVPDHKKVTLKLSVAEMNEDCNPPDSEALLLGSGCISNYGSNDGDLLKDKKLADTNGSDSIVSSKHERVWAVAACSLIACLASLMIGMIVGFSSPTLTQLDEPEHFSQQIEAGTIYASVFGVSFLLSFFLTWNALTKF